MLKRITIFTVVLLFVSVTVLAMVSTNQIKSREAKITMVMRHIQNPAHAVAFVALCEYLNMKVTMGLAICYVESGRLLNKQKVCQQYVWSDVKRGEGIVILARGYMGDARETTKAVMKNTPGMKYQGTADEYDAANNFYVGLVHAKDCIERFGIRKGLEIYNVGEGNYTYRGWRNKKYVSDVLSTMMEFKEELDSITEEQCTNQISRTTY